MTAVVSTHKRGRASNGALISTWIGEHPGPHTLIVAGQHGHELGPVVALLGWRPSVTHGIVTLIRCANVEGAANGTRMYRAGGEMLDMNSGWSGTDRRPHPALNVEIADHVHAVAGRSPDVVVDLHSGSASPPRLRPTEGAEPGLTVVVPLVAVGSCSSETRLVLTNPDDYQGQPSPSTTLAFRAKAELNTINEVLGAVSGASWIAAAEHVDGGWEVACIHQPGALADASAAPDVAAITVVFASDLPHRVPPSPPWERPFSSGDRRQRTLAEATRGVLQFVEWLVLPNCRAGMQRVAGGLELGMRWANREGWHSP
jgi:hypothetical protein